MNVAWVHAFSGAAGDMLMAALLDAGADLAYVRATIDTLGIDSSRLTVERTQRNGLAANRVQVNTGDDAHERSFADIRVMLAKLDGRTHERALAAFTALAETEAAIHGMSVETIHFHEVGSLDAIVDVVGVMAALESLDIDRVYCSPIAQGIGTVRAEHGVLPNPAPAVVALLARAGAPTYGLDLPYELTTPTGAAILTTTAAERFGPIPAMHVTSVGYGAGGRTMTERPNVVQVVVGTASPAAGSAAEGTPAVELAANVDDMIPEVLAHTVTALLAAGAHDAWITPIVMKKGRPAHTVHALCDVAAAASVRQVLLDETGTLGVRATLVQRWPQARTADVVHVEGHPIRVKRSDRRTKIEHDDAVAAATALGWPLRDVMLAAEIEAARGDAAS
jgi:pyridinium-3,5-bisthiocarboxylic acid mononucleotide nickel chelatase